MKKNLSKLFAVSLLLSVSIVSCKKDEEKVTPTPTPTPYTCTSCNTTPQAKAANDASSKGIYKGIVIGSTGTIKFDISNDGSTITAVLMIDGKTGNLTSTVAWVAGVSYVADFTGTFDGSPVTVRFKVDATGTNPMVLSSSIPGHASAAFVIDKENSTSLLECFEGTYSTTLPETGTFNILVSRKLGKFGGASRKSTSSTSEDIGNGTIDASGKLKLDGTDVGTLSGDEISGSFVDNNGKTVTIKGKRTL